MNQNEVWRAVEAEIGSGFRIGRHVNCSGGSISSAMRIEGSTGAFFVKLNDASLLHMFEAEVQGLREIAATAAVSVPGPVASGIGGGQAFLVLELLNLQSSTPKSNAKLGEQLALMHKSSGTAFGWRIDNTIGSTLQRNTATQDWIGFWTQQRFSFQLDLAQKNGCSGRLIENGRRLSEGLAGFFQGYTPVPSLLHGDLWAGNAAADDTGSPVIFDPACYYGDRETDVAMTELFGGFGTEFYRAYAQVWPLDPGYRVRKVLYNLYHVLNHFNLFGGGYQQQAGTMIKSLLAELG